MAPLRATYTSQLLVGLLPAGTTRLTDECAVLHKTESKVRVFVLATRALRLRVQQEVAVAADGAFASKSRSPTEV